MLKKIFFLLCWLGLLIAPAAFAWGCHKAKAADTTYTSYPASIQSQQFASEPFSAVDVSGPISVQINAGSRRYALQLVGDTASLSHVYAAVREGVLYLGLQPHTKPTQVGNVLAKVYMPQLSLLRYNGTGGVSGSNLTGPLSVSAGGSGDIILVGKNIDVRDVYTAGSVNVHILGVNSTSLNVYEGGTGNINLAGTAVLQSVTYNGNGTLSIEWVNTSNIKVVGAGKGRIFLAGVTNFLDATLSDYMFLDARYLHANRVLVNTRNHARADVWPQDNLTALATDGSNIYYYNDPTFEGGYMRTKGAVLRMVNIDR